MDLSRPEYLTREEILSTDLMDEIYAITSEVDRVLLLDKIETRAGELKIKRQFRELLKAQKQEIDRTRKELEASAKERDAAQPVANESMIILDSETMIQANTGRWTVNEHGVSSISFQGVIVACHYPIIISQRMINRESQKEKVTLLWGKDGRMKSIVAGKNVIASNSKIVSLAEYGVPVTSESARALVSYLADYEALNPGLIPVKVSTSKLGWIDGEFLPYGSDVIEMDADPSYKHVFDSVRAVGDPGAWMAAVKAVRASGRPEAAVYIAASFGSVLVSLVNVAPFLVNLYGESGRGKTVAMMLATSIWADPTQGHFIAESTSTINSLEQRLNLLNNLPLMIDDLSKIRDRDREKFTELIYMLCAGRGKGRLTRDIGLRETATWDNIILTNIERPLTDETMQGGAVNRVLDFEIQEGDIFKDGNAVVTTISATYGHAGRLFVEAVRQIGPAGIKELVAEYERQIREKATETGEEKEAKQITPLAVLLTADQIADEHIFHDGIRLNLDYCVRSLKGAAAVSEMHRAYEHLIDAVQINRNRFEPDDGGIYRGEIWGCFQNDGTAVAIIPAALEVLGGKYNFSPKQFVRWAQSSGLLVAKDGRHLATKVNLPGGNGRPRCYVFRLQGDGGADPDQPEEFMDVAEQAELPFEL